MIVEATIGIFFGAIVLLIIYFFLNWKEKRKLNKLKEEYNEKEDKSKESTNGVPGDTGTPGLSGVVFRGTQADSRDTESTRVSSDVGEKEDNRTVGTTSGTRKKAWADFS